MPIAAPADRRARSASRPRRCRDLLAEASSEVLGAPLSYSERRAGRDPEPAAFRERSCDATAVPHRQKPAARSPTRSAASTTTRNGGRARLARARPRRNAALAERSRRTLNVLCPLNFAALNLVIYVRLLGPPPTSRVILLEAAIIIGAGHLSGGCSRSPCDRIDWAVVVVYLVVDRVRRSAPIEGHRQGRRLFSRQPVAAVVGGRPVRDGHADERHHAGRHDRPGAMLTGLRFVQFYFGLPLAMIILSVTVVPFFHRAQGLHGLRVSRAAVRRADALADELSVSHGPRVLAGRHARRAGGGHVGDSRLEHAGHRAGDLRADGRLHQLRRRAGGGLDRRQADVHHRRRHGGGRRHPRARHSRTT